MQPPDNVEEVRSLFFEPEPSQTPRTSITDPGGNCITAENWSYVVPLLHYQTPMEMPLVPRSSVAEPSRWHVSCTCAVCSERKQRHDQGAFSVMDRTQLNQTIDLSNSEQPWDSTISATHFQIPAFESLSHDYSEQQIVVTPVEESPEFASLHSDMPIESYVSSDSISNPHLISVPNPETLGPDTDFPILASDRDLCISNSISSEFSNVTANDNNADPSCVNSISSDSRLVAFKDDNMINVDPGFDYVFSNKPSPEIDFNLPPIVPYKVHALTAANMPPPSVQAKQVALRVIRHARNNKTLYELAMCCLNCGLVPIHPVTGQCGHTRCAKCIQDNGPCPCGSQAPKNLHVNVVIQDLIGNMLFGGIATRICFKRLKRKVAEEIYRCTSTILKPKKCVLRIKANQITQYGPIRQQQRYVNRHRKMLVSTYNTCITTKDLMPRMPMSTQARFEYARELLLSGNYKEAAPHLARAAATSAEPQSRIASTLLEQTIAQLSHGRDPRRLARELYRSIRMQSAARWLRTTDLECVLCYHTYTKPVTTPCGHTYCRTCIERSLDYRKICPLCLRSLDNFNITTTRETAFVSAALSSIDALNPPSPPDPNVIPIFVCTVAYPAVPCPLFILNPRYWLMIRRVLESGSRKFGMIAYERNKTYSDYGTVLQVCDAVHLEDGRSILSTIGISRFRIIERDVKDGCDVARIQPLVDIIPTDEVVISELRLISVQISYKALRWLNSMSESVRSEIEAAFGELPCFEHLEDKWWESTDGPTWLWWLIAILPLRPEIKVLIVSTTSLLKRMMAVSRTLDIIDKVPENSGMDGNNSIIGRNREWSRGST